MTRRAFLIFLIILSTFAIDRVTKFFFLNEPPHRILPTILETTYHQNFGLIANLPVPYWIIVTSMILVLAVIGWRLICCLMFNVHCSLFTIVSIALIAGGALGNLYDRLTMGFVFDWIWIFQRSVINIADIAIASGIIWYLFASQSQRHQPSSGF